MSWIQPALSISSDAAPTASITHTQVDYLRLCRGPLINESFVLGTLVVLCSTPSAPSRRRCKRSRRQQPQSSSAQALCFQLIPSPRLLTTFNKLHVYCVLYPRLPPGSVNSGRQRGAGDAKRGETWLFVEEIPKWQNEFKLNEEGVSQKACSLPLT
jgi:hypothetical protein